MFNFQLNNILFYTRHIHWGSEYLNNLIFNWFKATQLSNGFGDYLSSNFRPNFKQCLRNWITVGPEFKWHLNTGPCI